MSPKICITRRAGLDRWRRQTDPTSVARLWAVVLLLRSAYVTWNVHDVALLPNQLQPLAYAFGALGLLAALDLGINDLMPPRRRYRLPRLRAVRWLIYMLACIACLIVAVAAEAGAEPVPAFGLMYSLVGIWMAVIAARDLVHQINKDAL